MKIIKPSGILALIAISTLCGCATSSITTNKSSDLKGPYKKIFLVIHSNIRVEPFSRPWLGAIEDEFNQRGISSKIYSLPDKENNSLSLESEDNAGEDVKKEISEFNPDALMVIMLRKIEAYGGVQVGRPGSNGATFDIKLFGREDPKTPVWRANFQVFGQYGISTAVKKGTSAFIKQLQNDNIIE
jgi:hypothetical protein